MFKSFYKKYFPIIAGAFIGLIGTSTILLLVDNRLFNNVSSIISHISSSEIFPILLISITVFTAIQASFSLLENTSNLKKTSREIDYLKMKLKHEQEISELKSLRLPSNRNLTEEERKELLEILKYKFENETVSSYLESLRKEIQQETYYLNFESKIGTSISRLELEIQSLTKRGNYNLSIGMVLSLLGLSVFGYILLNSQIYQSIEMLLINTLPKALFVILIELFSFFFLNLYKKNLDEIKYYQNEMTNLESKFLALQVAKSMNNHKILSLILEELSKTERNFILEKDQTTLELEKERISSNNSNNTLQAIKDIFKSKE
ncbi:hypothetical protein [Acinetobacter piscicola]|uniref:hypothetical protein n=1 Tax=Acinetobacter piscicola TaxID=2006115 RepID=UPI0010205D09|nr:hypothetical protein [Acinetobacter piscicola]RYL25911.1 hypothetical protein EWP19_10690 [Acinetobacter piscicola]